MSFALYTSRQNRQRMIILPGIRVLVVGVALVLLSCSGNLQSIVVLVGETILRFGHMTRSVVSELEVDSSRVLYPFLLLIPHAPESRVRVGVVHQLAPEVESLAGLRGRWDVGFVREAADGVQVAVLGLRDLVSLAIPTKRVLDVVCVRHCK